MPAHAHDTLAGIAREITRCRRCPRLVAWREHMALEKRAAFRDETYWGRPVPGFGDPCARLLLVGLAPAAHGGNRTGRMFTGDRSGDWVFRALHKAGFANQPTSTHRNDGLALTDAYVAAVVRCAPPNNKPAPQERDHCLPYLCREIAVLPRLSVIVAFGAFAWDGALRALALGAGAGATLPAKRPVFGHGAEAMVGPHRLIGSYHPSQQNTFTGRLTEAMFDGIFRLAQQRLTGPSKI